MGEPQLLNGLPLLDAGVPAVDPACCCCDCTVLFSYEEDDDDPCTLSFTDESTCECGAIVSWDWSVGEDTFSTDQNPSEINMETYGDGPWLVTLTVTDACGCEESASMYVACLPPTTTCCADLPSAAIVSVGSGFGTCSACTPLNGVFLVPLDVTGLGECTGTVAVSISGTCDGFSYTSIQVQVQIRPTGLGTRYIRVNMSAAGGGANYQTSFPNSIEDCKGGYAPVYTSDNWVTTGCTTFPSVVEVTVL